jgi:hypothetical protein
MNYYLIKDFSIYNLTLNISKLNIPVLLTPITLLSTVTANIDLLIEQKIIATILVKLPSGKLWYSEIDRYQESLNIHHIYNYQTNKQEFSDRYINIILSSNFQLKQEYFLLILTAEFCSLIVAKKEKNQEKKSPLLTINTFDGEIIQEVINEILILLFPIHQQLC